MRHIVNPRHPRGQMKRGAQGSSNTAGLKGGGNAASNALKGSKQKKIVTRSSRTEFSPLYIVIDKYRFLFATYSQDRQNICVKKQMLDHTVQKCSNCYSDPNLFWEDLLDEANVLLGSPSFIRYCKNVLKLDPQAVAENIVADGYLAVNLVMKKGLKSYDQYARRYTVPLSTYLHHHIDDQCKADDDISVDAVNHGQ